MKTSSIITFVAFAAKFAMAIPSTESEADIAAQIAKVEADSHLTDNEISLADTEVSLADGELNAAAVCYRGACVLGGLIHCNNVCRNNCACARGGCNGLTCVCGGC